MFPVDDFDFHTHSRASDGVLPPAAVVTWAVERGIRHLALTDHDTLDGVAEAQEAAIAAGIGFVAGVEISAEWQDRGKQEEENAKAVHIVGLGVDTATTTVLQEGLRVLRGGRIERARRMDEAFSALGIPGTFAGAMRYAAIPELISRAHFARYLVELGLFKEPGRVFEHYLTPGKPGYVRHRWVDLAEAVAWIRAAGGVAVVAHPGRYKLTSGAMQRFLEDFRDLGGEAIEVVSGSHTPEHVSRFAHVARQFGFYASRGSDFHDPAAFHASKLMPLPEDLVSIRERLA
ncbi:MAG: PHP domain-containing protein [Zoogloeaceae bacterium]|nr:PHP domain-containing protein [Zoogloeaceae bacterium]